MQVPFPLSSAPGNRPQEAAGRILNAYAEPLGQGARSQAVYRRVPGLVEFANSSEETFRGSVQVASTLYLVFDNAVVSTNESGGAVTAEDDLAGDNEVFIAVNNNSTPHIVVVDPDEGAFVIDSTNGDVDDYPDNDLPQPADVCFIDGYFFFPIADGRCFSSGINSTSINSNDFITAEAKRDSLLRGVPWNGQLLLWGTGSCEVWSGDNPNLSGFPFNRVTVIQRGLAGRYCVTGYQDGFGKALAFVGDDNGVHVLNGYQAEKISPPDLDRLIERTADKSTIKMYSYVSRGRGIIVVKSPSWCWEFNLASQKWNERQSYLRNTWRGVAPYYAFGKWLCGDDESGNIYQIDADVGNEGGNPLRFRLESGPVHQFPNRVQIARIDIDVVTGVGIATGDDPSQTDPTIELSVSRDSGATWDDPRFLKLGRQAITDQRVYDTRFGLSGPQGPRIRIDIASDVDVGVMAADMYAAMRQK
jgi:Phage stabilisation protein